ncbi:MAG: hypothetical protein KC996_02495 [Phycisphaerales bacterium]|nr:hypothetical protein [Phycisphaerales bacterium]
MGADTQSELTTLFTEIAHRAERAAVFGGVEVTDQGLVCAACNSAEPASYRVFSEKGALWVSLSMKDRWQSESIESELVHSGDKLNELIDDELDDLGVEDPRSTFEHFRSPELEFVFRSRVPIDPSDPSAAEVVGTWLLAYEQCFRQLGDMDVTEEDDD